MAEIWQKFLDCSSERIPCNDLSRCIGIYVDCRELQFHSKESLNDPGKGDNIVHEKPPLDAPCGSTGFFTKISLAIEFTSSNLDT
jgi:hypothetical protein